MWGAWRTKGGKGKTGGMPAEATVLWARAREKHIPSRAEPRAVPGDPYFLSAAWTSWLVSSWKALEVGRLNKERPFTAVLGRLYTSVHSADIYCALGLGMNGEAGRRRFRTAAAGGGGGVSTCLL